ncbi:hypothetical protein D5041_20090 [Verminephrobacter aporrectodeae subsp. tuberculatae]|uniref:hypothetical protein n=1 Tax=Verminephrobacter aporrectodeae TaxID=1110389 RepID=UPI002237B260|nr:hypothetical protein [Verminephrobacter aporrectodeae]MCW5221952.1 hypothetical protein [Verminephrobacter aporrectodeae subsp. tuberculatae]MCW5291243.1 hypothetical protein [Verminephrobacter aporrectodeae subsp. tuberculatae]
MSCRRWSLARQAIKEIVEMPDQQADRLLRSIEQNQGELSHALAKEMPVLAQPHVWSAMTEAVAKVFRDEPPMQREILDRYRPARVR